MRNAIMRDRPDRPVALINIRLLEEIASISRGDLEIFKPAASVNVNSQQRQPGTTEGGKKFENSIGGRLWELYPELNAHLPDVLGRKRLASKLDLLNARTN